MEPQPNPPPSSAHVFVKKALTLTGGLKTAGKYLLIDSCLL